MANPLKFKLLRGNHETRRMNLQYGFAKSCTDMFGRARGYDVFERMSRVFDAMPVAAIIDDHVFAAHGGVSRPVHGSFRRMRHLFASLPSHIESLPEGGFRVGAVRSPAPRTESALDALDSLRGSGRHWYEIALEQAVAGAGAHGPADEGVAYSAETLDAMRERDPPVLTHEMARMVYDLVWADPATPEQEYLVQHRLRERLETHPAPILGTPRVGSDGQSTAAYGAASAQGGGALRAASMSSLSSAAHSDVETVSEVSSAAESDRELLELAFLDRVTAEDNGLPREHLPRVMSFSNSGVDAFCRGVRADLILRGHTLKDDGFGLEKQRRVLTIFSDSKDHGVNGRSGWVLIEDRGAGEGSVHLHLGGQSRAMA